MIHRENYLKQPTAGAVSWNSYGEYRGILGQLTINPSVSTTTYNFSLTADTGAVVYNKKGIKGVYVDDSKIPLYGIYTMAIANSSESNYSFTTTLIWDDDYR